MAENFGAPLPSIVEQKIPDTTAEEYLTESFDTSQATAPLAEVEADQDLELPTVPYLYEDSGEVGFLDIETEESFSITLVGVDQVTSVGEASTLTDVERQVNAVSHITAEGAIQTVAVTPAETQYVDFDITVPEGRSLELQPDGSIVISGRNGDEGRIDVPWAYDQNGNELDTSYEITPEGDVRQRFVPREDSTTVVLDPSVWWWTSTASRCALDLALFFTPVKLAKLVNSITKIAKSSRVAQKAVEALGGPYQAAVAVVKNEANKLKAKLGKWGNALPSFPLTDDQKRDAGRLAAFTGEALWDFLGLGSCGALARELI